MSSRTDIAWGRRLRRWWKNSGWAILGVMALTVLLLGMRGFALSAEASGTPSTIADRFYLSLGLFVLQTGAVPPPVSWELEIARLLAPFIAAVATARIVMTVLSEKLTRIRTRRLRDHVVICGLDRIGVHLTRGFTQGEPTPGEQGEDGRAKTAKVIAVEKDPNGSEITQSREKGIMVLVGDAADPETLRAAGVSQAAYLFAVCGDDSVNGKIAERASELKRTDQGALRCFVRVSSPEHRALIDDLGDHLPGREQFSLYAFDVTEIGAERMLDKPGKLSPNTVSGDQHVVVVGAGEMGQKLVLEAAKRWRSISVDLPSPRIMFTLVDRDANRHRELLLALDSSLDRAGIEPFQLDIGSAQLDIGSAAFRQGDFLAYQQTGPLATRIYVCLSDDIVGLGAARTLRHRLGDTPVVPIVVRTKTYGGLPALIRGIDDSVGIILFELLKEVCSPEAVRNRAERCDQRRFDNTD